MKMIIRCLLLTFTISCASIPPEDEVSIFQLEYAHIAPYAPQSIPIRFSHYLELYPGHEVVGLCTVNYLKNTSIIELNIDVYKKLTTIERRALIYHEMAHCADSREHLSDLLPDGCPYSLMHPTLPDLGCLEKHWTHYLKELPNP